MVRARSGRVRVRDRSQGSKDALPSTSLALRTLPQAIHQFGESDCVLQADSVPRILRAANSLQAAKTIESAG